MSHSRFFYTPSIDTAELAHWLDSKQQAASAMGLFVMLAEQDAAMVPPLQALCRQRHIRLAGAIFPQLIWNDEFYSTGALFYCLPCRPPVLLQDNLNDSAGQPKADALAKLINFCNNSLPNGRLLTVFDGLVPNISTIMQSIYASIGDKLAYMGIAAGSETFQAMPCLFDNDRLIDNGVLALLLPPSAELRLECGYSVPDELIPTTSSTGNRIQQINWRPAFDVYVELVQRHYHVAISKDNFYQHAVHFPFGIMRADGEVLVRIPVALLEDGSLLCVGEIPSNALLTVVHAIEPGSDDSVKRLAAALENIAAEEHLLFYCAGRRMHLGEDALREIRHINTAVTPARLGGALTLGEIGSARASHFPLFYNAAIVVIAGLCT